MRPTAAKLDDTTPTGDDWYAEWLRSVALGASAALAAASVIVVITNPTAALVAFPSAVVWAMATIALARREIAAGPAVGMCGAVFAIAFGVASARAFGDGADSRGWTLAAGLLLSATTAATSTGWWLTRRSWALPAELGPAGRWPHLAEAACYISGGVWVLFGFVSLFAIVPLALIGLGWIIAGFAVGRGLRAPAVLVAIVGAIFTAIWLAALVRGSGSHRSVPAWVWGASGLWCASAAAASVAATVTLVKAARRR